MGPLREAQLNYSYVKFPPTLIAVFSVLNLGEETWLANLAKATIVAYEHNSHPSNLWPMDSEFNFLSPGSHKTKSGFLKSTMVTNELKMGGSLSFWKIPTFFCT